MDLARFFRSFGEPLRQAVATCAGRPLRTALGTLAIAVAVATLTLVQTAIDGLGTYARRSAARVFGSDTFVLAQIAAPGQVPRRELERKLARNPPLLPSDLRFLEAYAGDRVFYAASVQRPADVTAGGRKFENASVTGTGARLPEIRDLGIAEGRFFLPDEERRGAQVAIVGYDIAERLFPGGDPLGRTVRLASRGFRVIGVQSRLGTSGGVSLDRYIWIPLTAWERAFGPAGTLQISARPPEELPVELAEDRARATMRARRGLAPGEEDNFDILSPEAARTFVLNLARRIGAVAPLLSAMALLAAIVVVTNTVLVSVTQRTREIGVRRAVGARRDQIVREILAESVLLAVAGGVAGIAAAVTLMAAVTTVLPIPLVATPRTLAVALIAAAGSGVAAGWYPALRATRLDVITALRSE